jgi:hypothetical protein
MNLPTGDQMHLAHEIANALHGLNNRAQKSIPENQLVVERVLARWFTPNGTTPHATSTSARTWRASLAGPLTNPMRRIPSKQCTHHDALGLLMLAALVWFIHLLCKLPH